MQFFTDNILLIFILPIIAAGLAFSAKIFKFSVSENTVKFSTITASVVSLVFASALFYSYNFGGVSPFEIYTNWLRLGETNLSLGILIDKFSTIFFLGFAIIAFATNCLMVFKYKDDSKFCQYIGYLNLFTVFSELLIFSQNIPQAYILSILTGVFAYLSSDLADEKSENSSLSLILNRIGDVAFLIGLIVFISFVINSDVQEGSSLLAFSELHMFAPDFYVYLSDAGFYTACLFIIIGIVAKTGMFPMYNIFENQSKMPAPMYSTICSLMIGTGLFLFVRLISMFELSETILNTIYILSAITIIVCMILFLFVNNRRSYYMQAMAAILFLPVPKTLFYIVFAAFVLATLTDIILQPQCILIKLPTPIQNVLKSIENISNLYRWFGDNIVDFFANFTKVVDKYIINGFLKIINILTRFISWCVSLTQNGNIQSYIAFGIIGTAAILIVYILLIIGIGEM